MHFHLTVTEIVSSMSCDFMSKENCFLQSKYKNGHVIGNIPVILLKKYFASALYYVPSVCFFVPICSKVIMYHFGTQPCLSNLKILCVFH